MDSSSSSTAQPALPLGFEQLVPADRGVRRRRGGWRRAGAGRGHQEADCKGAHRAVLLAVGAGNVPVPAPK